MWGVRDWTELGGRLPGRSKYQITWISGQICLVPSSYFGHTTGFLSFLQLTATLGTLVFMCASLPMPWASSCTITVQLLYFSSSPREAMLLSTEFFMSGISGVRQCWQLLESMVTVWLWHHNWTLGIWVLGLLDSLLISTLSLAYFFNCIPITLIYMHLSPVESLFLDLILPCPIQLSRSCMILMTYQHVLASPLSYEVKLNTHWWLLCLLNAPGCFLAFNWKLLFLPSAYS